MTDIFIHRCSLRVVRRSGWSWGEDPKRLVQGVIRNFPALLAQKLSALLPEEDVREFAAPIRLRIPVRMSELLGGAATGADVIRPGEARPTASFEQRLDLVLHAAFGLGIEAEHETVPPDRFPPVGPTGGGEDRTGAREGGALERLLLDWAKEGALEAHLVALSDDQITAWHDALLRGLARHGTRAEPSELALSARIDAFVQARAVSLVTQTPTDRLRQRILLASEAAEGLNIPLTHFLLWQALDRLLPVERSPSPRRDAPAQDGVTAMPDAQTRAALALVPQSRSATLTAQHSRLYAVSAQSPDWDVKIDCALPFLLLGPLARLGYVAALAAVLEGAGLTDEGSLFAAALAYKVLDPPERGWRRSPGSVLAAAAFGGSRDTVSEESLVDFSRRIAPHMGALDLVLADAVTAGHVPGEPVVLHRMDPENETGLLLVDTPGCFPLACANGIEPLLPVLQRLGTPVLMVSSDAATPRLLGDLDAAGLTFVSDVPPTRHEPWRRVQRGALRLGWTNSSEPASDPVLRAARKFAAVCDEAEDLWRELAVARPGVVRAHSPELDRSLTLAAAVAMGIASWKLWQDAGPANPQRALHRYSDLDARVRFDGASVAVSLPLGRRHQELGEAGLLAPIDGIPWLGGRRIEFSGG